MIVVVMGPAGSGKSTVGSALARDLGWPFLDGDSLHSPASVGRIKSGHSLSEEERAPWLAAIARTIADALDRQQPLVVACSALRRAHRAALRPPDAAQDAVRFVYLKVSRTELARRLRARTDHFAPPTLLRSQLATLEEPDTTESGTVTIDAERDVQQVLEAIRRVAFRHTP